MTTGRFRRTAAGWSRAWNLFHRWRPDDEVPSEPAVRRRLMAGGIARTP